MKDLIKFIKFFLKSRKNKLSFNQVLDYYIRENYRVNEVLCLRFEVGSPRLTSYYLPQDEEEFLLDMRGSPYWKESTVHVIKIEDEPVSEIKDLYYLL